jgi:hypothetical protein
VGVITNPTNVAASSEQLGAYQRSQTFPRSLDIGVFLTEREEELVTEAIYAPPAGASTRSVFDRIVNMNEGRDADEDE